MFLKTNPDHLAHAFFGVIDQLAPESPTPCPTFAAVLHGDRVHDETRFARLTQQNHEPARPSLPSILNGPAEGDWCFPCGAD